MKNGKKKKRLWTKSRRSSRCIWLLWVSISLLALNIFSKMETNKNSSLRPVQSAFLKWAYHRYLKAEWIFMSCPVIQIINGNFGTTNQEKRSIALKQKCSQKLRWEGRSHGSDSLGYTVHMKIKSTTSELSLELRLTNLNYLDG